MKKTLLSLGGGLAVFAFLAIPASAATCPAGTVQKDFQEGIIIPSNGNNVSSNVLGNGKTYLIETSGTYNYGPRYADAKCSDRNGVIYDDGDGWTPGESLPSPWQYYLQVWINGNNASDNWGADCNLDDHTYSTLYSGNGTAVNFSIKDNAYGDNSGNLTAKIYECEFERTAEITSPEEKEVVSGTVSFDAYLMDDDQDSVQWAVRKGTCAANQGTVFGNVDGKNNTYQWDYNNYRHDFHFDGDMSEMEDGMYCFVFNPKEDSGESDIRLARAFYLDNDEDDDGILNSVDMCLETETEEIDLNPNHFAWRGNENFTFSMGLIPGKGKANGPKKSFTLQQTHGCSCEQILEELRESNPEEYGEMKGQEKHGCSISVMEEFIEMTKED